MEYFCLFEIEEVRKKKTVISSWTSQMRERRDEEEVELILSVSQCLGVA